VDPQKSVVTVDIAGQRYPIRSGLDPAYVAELAAYVDKKVLVALNLADEYFRARQNESTSHGDLHARALRLEQLVDQVLSR
jgi:cell division protein ZapA (FtsZ GTPase activity inhibitor)